MDWYQQEAVLKLQLVVLTVKTVNGALLATGGAELANGGVLTS